jgi:hypothetical protein
MTLVLIPAIAEFAEQIGDSGGEWVEELNAWTEDNFGVTPIEQGAADDAAGAAGGALEEWAHGTLTLLDERLAMARPAALWRCRQIGVGADPRRRILGRWNP